jgi:hypothetical protein
VNILSLLTAFGLGSVVTALIQSWLAQRSKQDERRFREKQAAYIGLLEAYHRAAVEGTDEAAKNFALWQMRCELVAPEAVRRAIERIVETNEDRAGRTKAHDELKAAFRTDLGIAK